MPAHPEREGSWRPGKGLPNESSLYRYGGGEDESSWASAEEILPIDAAGVRGRGRLGGEPGILVDEAAEPVPTHDAPSSQERSRYGRAQPQAAMGTLHVVVGDVRPQDLFQVARAEDQEPVQTLPAHGAHPALGMSIRAGDAQGSADDLHAFRGEDLVEGHRVLLVSIMDQESWLEALLDLPGEVAGLLSDPGAGRVLGGANHEYATAGELDKEQDVHDLEPHRLHREKVAGQQRLGVRC